ncbi:MAG: helix-turn-helix domain-containing protein [Bacillota bacterium]
MEIGSTLRNAREAKGLSLEAAEEHTKIRRKYLKALENEKFEILPGKVYVKGFLKNYAKFLGLNANSLVSAYEERLRVSGTEKEEEDKTGERLTDIERPRGRGIYKLAIGLAAVAVAVYMVLPSVSGTGSKMIPRQKAPDSMTAGDKSGQEKAPQDRVTREAAQEKAQNVPPARQGVNLVLNVTENRSWMYVEVDGKPAFTGFMDSGQMKEFKGSEKIILKLGNAGVVQVEVNGQKMGVLGSFGQVVTKEFMAPQG